MTTGDTAGSAREVAEWGDKSRASLAPQLAADIYGLDVLARFVEDESTTPPASWFCRASLWTPGRRRTVVTTFVFRVRNVPSALYKALGGFATNGVNMTKLESYMVNGEFAATQFLADVEGHPDDANLARALEELRFFSETVSILGAYPAHGSGRDRPGHRKRLIVNDLTICCSNKLIHVRGDVPLFARFRLRHGASIAERRGTNSTAQENPAEQFRLLADNMPVLCWIADATGYITWYNRRWYEYTGTTAAEMEGWGWQKVHDPQTLDEVLARWTSSLASGEPFDMVLPLRSAAGEYRPFLTRVAPYRDASGRILRWFGNNVEVTAQRAVETALAEREAQLRDLVATLDLGALLVRDLDGKIRFWSAGCQRLYGWSAAEAVGQSTHDLLKTTFPAPWQEVEAALLADGEWSGDLTQSRRDGTRIVVAARKAVRRDATGRPCAVMENIDDVTALRRAEKQLRSLNAELEVRVHEEMQARQTAQGRLVQAEKLGALGQLAGGVAHDFNNILQAVTGGASMIRRNADDPAKVKRFAELVEDAGRRAAPPSPFACSPSRAAAICAPRRWTLWKCFIICRKC